MITWPIAITIIGGIASICLTVLKIVSMRKDTKPNEELEQYSKDNKKDHQAIVNTLTDAKERLIVLETKFDDHIGTEDEDRAEIKGQINKLTDIIMEVLKRIKVNGD